MAKRGTIGYQAELLRKKGQRRIERLEGVLKAGDTPQRVRNWAKTQIREIKSAMQGTRQYSKSGKRYKSKSQNYIRKQIDRLTAAIKEVAPRYTVAGDSFEVTQRELNRASVKAPSIYTKTEVQLFYRVTQKIWQREGVGEHDRNEAILNYYNSIRRENGLSPLRLDQIVEYVLNANQHVKQMQRVNPSEYMDEEALAFYEEAGALDNADGEMGSPAGVTQIVVSEIRDAMENILVQPTGILFSDNPTLGAQEFLVNDNAQLMQEFLNSMM